MAKRNATRNTNSKKLVPAVSYIRMSTDDQEKSPEQQREEIEKLARTSGFRIVREYCDEGISGTETTKRPNFMRLISDAQSRCDFHTILAWDQNRLFRTDPMETNHYFYLLREAGVEVVTVRQGNLNLESDDIGQIITREIASHNNNAYCRNISADVSRGIVSRLNRNELNIKMPPYGCDKLVFDEHDELQKRLNGQDKFKVPSHWTATLVPSENRQQVQTVRWMYKTFEELDIGLRQLATRLNAKKIASWAGGNWTIGSVAKVLGNPVYCGDYVFGMRRKGKFNLCSADGVVPASKGQPLIKPEEDWIIIRDQFKPIVSRTLWDRVQFKRANRRPTRCPKRGIYYLSGLLFCGHCGGRMVARPDREPGMERYICGTNVRNGGPGCKGYSIQQRGLLAFLIGRLREIMLVDENLGMLKNKIKELLEARQSERSSESKAARKRLPTLERQIKQAAKRLARCPDDVADILTAEIQEMQRERDELLEIAREASGSP